MMKKIIRFSLLITFPISVVFILWLYGTLSFFSQLNKIESASYMFGENKNLYITGEREFMQLKRKFTSLSENRLNRDINIYTKNSNLNALNSNLPESGFEYKKAFLLTDKKIFQGKIKYRGSNLYHWIMPHKSWRFKAKKNHLYKNVRKWDFIIWKDEGLPLNHLGYMLARSMGILAPYSESITLNINNKDNGVKMMVEQIDEGFLRNNRRVPGDIYKISNAGVTRIQGVDIDIFTTPSVWKKISINNHYRKDNSLPLQRFFTQIQKKDNKLMDKESFVDYMVFIDLIGTFHVDFQQNWILFYDNYLERFYPIAWDIGPWLEPYLKRKVINVNNNRIFSSFYNDYELFISKYYGMYEFFNNKEKKFLLRLNSELEKAKEKIDQVGYTYTFDGKYKSSKETDSSINELKNRVKSRFSFVKEKFLGESNLSDYRYSIENNSIRVSISGNKLIYKIDINMNSPIEVEEVYLSYNTAKKKINRKILFELDDNNKSLKLDVDLLARVEEKPIAYEEAEIVFEEATYDILIPEVDLKNIEFVSFSSLSYRDNQFKIKRVSHIERRLFTNQKNIVKDVTIGRAEQWRGIKRIKGFNLITHDLKIEAGTKIILDANATLKVLGRVTAIGTEDKPILFEAKDKSTPWSTFVLKDSKANGSLFKHCIFKEGSGNKGELYEYTGLLSIHNVKDFLIEDCTFSNSHRTDDMVHVIYSTGKFKNTKFIHALSDALDVDISNVLIDNCEFIDSGNDAIDLMTSNAIVINSKFANSKDKAISIGEGSKILAVNNLIKGSSIGMQSKDSSKAYVYNSTFVDNNQSVDAYHKNWRYSKGGTITLEKCLFERNNFNATVGKKSKVIINNSEIDSPKNFNSKSIKKGKIIICNRDFIQYDFKEPFFRDKTYLINKEKRGYHE